MPLSFDDKLYIALAVAIYFARKTKLKKTREITDQKPIQELIEEERVILIQSDCIRSVSSSSPLYKEKMRWFLGLNQLQHDEASQPIKFIDYFLNIEHMSIVDEFMNDVRSSISQSLKLPNQRTFMQLAARIREVLLLSYDDYMIHSSHNGTTHTSFQACQHHLIASLLIIIEEVGKTGLNLKRDCTVYERLHFLLVIIHDAILSTIRSQKKVMMISTHDFALSYEDTIVYELGNLLKHTKKLPLVSCMIYATLTAIGKISS